jgi:regulator of sirC expression with transglutaminase-like and TPR domain
MEPVADPDAVARFAALVSAVAGPARLDEMALALAGCFEPELDLDLELARLDVLAKTVRKPTLAGLRSALFEDAGFIGDRATYYDPTNSFLDRVIDRRRGIPITLAILTIEVGRRVGVPLSGIGLPGHFVVRDEVDTSSFIDVFGGGSLIDRRGCVGIIEEIQGSGAILDDGWFEPVDSRAIAARMLTNLEGCYRRFGDSRRAAVALELRTMVPGSTARERRRIAESLAGLGRFDRAASVFEELAHDRPDAADDLRAAAHRLRARLN